jgi:hypothetical protein
MMNTNTLLFHWTAHSNVAKATYFFYKIGGLL